MYLSGDNMKCGSGYTISYCALEYSIVINSCKSPSYMHRKWDLYNNLKDTTLHREVIMQKRRVRICDFFNDDKKCFGIRCKICFTHHHCCIKHKREKHRRYCQPSANHPPLFLMFHYIAEEQCNPDEIQHSMKRVIVLVPTMTFPSSPKYSVFANII